jgi:hypothetical protein
VQAATPDEPVFEVLDDLVPAELFAEARKVCAGKGWYFGHGSHDADDARFWKMDLDGDPTFDAIWKHIQRRCEEMAGGTLRVIRQYANGHTYGLGGKPHFDDNRPGCYTLLYYPMEEWKHGWDGETVFFDGAGEIASAVRPKPNRAVFFDSRILHAGRAPSRSCTALRVSVAYKLEAVSVTPVVVAEPAVVNGVPASGEIRIEESTRDGARRVYAVHVSQELVERRKQEQLASLGETVRLPGFRPGKIPAAVVEQRYGARARANAVSRLGAECADRLMLRGSLASEMTPVSGVDSGDLQFHITVTHLPDLPAVDFAELEVERLSAGEADLHSLGLTAESASAIFTDHLRQQVLDYLNVVYEFPLAAALVEREFAAIWSTAAAQIEAEATSRAAREEISAELREIAERRVRLGAVVAEMARRYEIRLTGDELEAERIGAETPGQTRSRVTEARVMDYFLKQARVTERSVDIDELRDLAAG